MKKRKHCSTALLNADRNFQGRDMTLSVAVADAPTNSRGTVLARGPVCSYKSTAGFNHQQFVLKER